MKGITKLETNISTQPAPESKDSWIPCSDAHPGRSQRAEAAAAKRAASPDSMKGEGRQYSFPKDLRLLKRHEFRRVYEEGRRESSRICTIFTRSNGLPQSRLGLTTPSALGRAVVRNRIRRRLREVFRLNRARIAAGWDIVLNPRPKIATMPFEALTREILRLFPAGPPPQPPSGQGKAPDLRH